MEPCGSPGPVADGIQVTPRTADGKRSGPDTVVRGAEEVGVLVAHNAYAPVTPSQPTGLSGASPTTTTLRIARPTP